MLGLTRLLSEPASSCCPLQHQAYSLWPRRPGVAGGGTPLA